MRFASCPRLAGLAGLVALQGGCASAPPPLPPPRDAAAAVVVGDPRRCAEILGELAAIDTRMQALAERIAADRERDQVAGYAAAVTAVLFPPTLLILAADTNTDTRIEATRLYDSRDAVVMRAAQSGCALPDRPMPPRASAPG